MFLKNTGFYWKIQVCGLQNTGLYSQRLACLQLVWVLSWINETKTEQSHLSTVNHHFHALVIQGTNDFTLIKLLYKLKSVSCLKCWAFCSAIQANSHHVCHLCYQIKLKISENEHVTALTGPGEAFLAYRTWKLLGNLGVSDHAILRLDYSSLADFACHGVNKWLIVRLKFLQCKRYPILSMSSISRWKEKGCVNPVPASILKPELKILFTILNMNIYSIITNINNSFKQTFPVKFGFNSA